MRFDESNFLANLKQARPDPGGGSTSAYTALVALALAEKICVLEALRAKKKRSDSKAIDSLLQRVRLKSDSFKTFIERDVIAYERLAASIKAGKRWPENYDIVSEAIECPHGIMLETVESIQLIADIGRGCRNWLIPDLLVVLELMHASVKAAFHIAIANTSHIEETRVLRSRTDELELALRKCERRYFRVLESLKSN